MEQQTFESFRRALTGNLHRLMLWPGQAHDLACPQLLLENTDPQACIADKAYDADAFIDALAARDIIAVIPPKANCKTKRECDFAVYCERNLIRPRAISPYSSRPQGQNSEPSMSVGRELWQDPAFWVRQRCDWHSFVRAPS